MATLTEYLGLIASEHRDKPKYIAFLTAVLDPLVANINVAMSLPDKFDVDTATGVQLDAVGLWVGASRYVPVELQDVYFTWNDVVRPNPSRLGWNLGFWRAGGELIKPATYLPDPLYRIFIYARIANNEFKGNLLNAYKVLSKVYVTPSSSIVVSDNQNMTVSLVISGVINPSLKLLAQGGYLQIDPMGVRLITTYP